MSDILMTMLMERGVECIDEVDKTQKKLEKEYEEFMESPYKKSIKAKYPLVKKIFAHVRKIEDLLGIESAEQRTEIPEVRTWYWIVLNRIMV